MLLLLLLLGQAQASIGAGPRTCALRFTSAAPARPFSVTGMRETLPSRQGDASFTIVVNGSNGAEGGRCSRGAFRGECGRVDWAWSSG
jgi:hypothetical protein